MEGLTTGNCIAIVALVVASIGATFTSANFFAGYRERQRNAESRRPLIKCTINKAIDDDGWQSVQLHVEPVNDDQKNFRYDSWRIERATLLRPKSAILARAADDDYASGVFFAEHPVRTLEGKPIGRPQGFALEFFIKFLRMAGTQKADFKVTFSHIKTGKRYTRVVAASVC